MEANIAQMRNEIKQLPLEEKKVKTADMRRLQQQTTMLHAQQQQREEKVEELQAKSKRVIGLIHLVHQKVHEVESNMSEHVSSDLV